MMDLKSYRLGLPLRQVPLPLLVAVAGLVAYGAVFVSSAAGSGTPAGLAVKHLLWAGLGLAAFLVALAADFRVYLRGAWLVYGGALLALLAVLFTRPVKGAHSWFDLGFMKAQPSEFAKLAVLLALARYLGARREIGAREMAASLAICAVPVALILKQPDMGTAMVFVPLAAVVLFVAGARVWHLAGLAGASAGGAFFLWKFLMHDYQRERIYAWLDPEPYRLGKAYQLIQSQIAVGSGGVWGKGLGHGTQNQFDLLPLKESDFIFAVIAEEGGFLAACGLLLLVVLLVLAGVSAALRASDRQGRLVAAGAAALLGGQALINVGVNIGLLPTTGITLPFVSYGGSSMLASFAAAGLIANVAARPSGPGLFT